RRRALDTLRSRGVEVRLEESIRSAGATSVTLSSGEVLRAHTVVWTAGVRAVPLADRLGLEQATGGRVVVADDLSVPGHDGVYAIGDLAASRYPHGGLHPQVAQLALQGAAHVVAQLKRRREGLPPTAFVYRGKGIMATIGRNAAV